MGRRSTVPTTSHHHVCQYHGHSSRRLTTAVQEPAGIWMLRYLPPTERTSSRSTYFPFPGLEHQVEESFLRAPAGRANPEDLCRVDVYTQRVALMDGQKLQLTWNPPSLPWSLPANTFQVAASHGGKRVSLNFLHHH